MIKKLNNNNPTIHKDSFIAKSANIIGDINIGEGSSIWYGAVLRGDFNNIKIGKFSNVQDNVTVHNDIDSPVIIGDYTSIGHNAVIHGCTIGNNCLIGMGAIILNNAVIGDNSIIAAGSVVTEEMNIPPNSLVMGLPAKIRRELTSKEIDGIKENANTYTKLWREKYK